MIPPARPPEMAAVIVRVMAAAIENGRCRRLGCVPSMKSYQSIGHYDPDRTTDRKKAGWSGGRHAPKKKKQGSLGGGTPPRTKIAPSFSTTHPQHERAGADIVSDHFLPPPLNSYHGTSYHTLLPLLGTGLLLPISPPPTTLYHLPTACKSRGIWGVARPPEQILRATVSDHF